jgi:hypothetical protein
MIAPNKGRFPSLEGAAVWRVNPARSGEPNCRFVGNGPDTGAVKSK